MGRLAIIEMSIILVINSNTWLNRIVVVLSFVFVVLWYNEYPQIASMFLVWDNHSDDGIKTDTLLYWILYSGNFSLQRRYKSA